MRERLPRLTLRAMLGIVARPIMKRIFTRSTRRSLRSNDEPIRANTHPRTWITALRSFGLWGAFAIAVMLITAGCSQRETEFDIVNLRGVNDREHFHEPFDECYYTIAPGGRIDIIARHRSLPTREAPAVSQIIHLRTAFRSIPGVTHSDSTMINATVQYAIIDGQGGVSFAGAGFVSTAENSRGEMVGALERSILDMHRQVGSGGQIFDRAEVTGSYRATRNRRKVIALLNELDRVFGPTPDHEPKRSADPL